MSSKTTDYCDECEKEIAGGSGLHLMVYSISDPNPAQGNWVLCGEFCSPECVAEAIRKKQKENQ